MPASRATGKPRLATINGSAVDAPEPPAHEPAKPHPALVGMRDGHLTLAPQWAAHPAFGERKTYTPREAFLALARNLDIEPGGDEFVGFSLVVEARDWKNMVGICAGWFGWSDARAQKFFADMYRTGLLRVRGGAQ